MREEHVAQEQQFGIVNVDQTVGERTRNPLQASINCGTVHDSPSFRHCSIHCRSNHMPFTFFRK